MASHRQVRRSFEGLAARAVCVRSPAENCWQAFRPGTPRHTHARPAHARPDPDTPRTWRFTSAVCATLPQQSQTPVRNAAHDAVYAPSTRPCCRVLLLWRVRGMSSGSTALAKRTAGTTASRRGRDDVLHRPAMSTPPTSSHPRRGLAAATLPPVLFRTTLRKAAALHPRPPAAARQRRSAPKKRRKGAD